MSLQCALGLSTQDLVRRFAWLSILHALFQIIGVVVKCGGGGGSKHDAAMLGAHSMNFAVGLKVLQKEHQERGTRAELLVRQPQHKAVSKEGSLTKQELVFNDGCGGSRASLVRVGNAFACGGPDHEDHGLMVRLLRVCVPFPVHHIGTIRQRAISRCLARLCEWGKHTIL
jgi:hypothetical protein